MNPLRQALSDAEALVQKLKDATAIVMRLAIEDQNSVQNKLSERELEVYDLIAKGLDFEQIAEKMNITKKTVEIHRDHIKEKLGIKRSKDLYRQARAS